MKDLYFRDNGSFTIVQFTDLHWKNGNPKDIQTYSLMKRILEVESPDLVVFTGDVIHSEECEDPFDSYRNAVRVVEEFGIPWASVFGNHDAEMNCSKTELISLQHEHRHCLTETGPELENRFGNYLLRVKSKKSDESIMALYMFDSGSNLNHPIGGYEWITHSQINWYKENSRQLTMSNKGMPLLSLAFFHIPLPEYNEVWNYHICYGHNYEGMGCPKVNSGLFTAFLEMNDVKGVFVGHDHINDFWGELHGIRLFYGRATGYNTYGKEGFSRGARIIRLFEEDRSYQSWIRLDDGTKVDHQQRHDPDHVWKRI
ncbi:metallophosphoesterase family protein [Bacillus sp. BRMEA1]|uniref:metallophosphoesterase family protein n=1 Tax=Neobacillus endophyticus TaxID=2738405 RepID=UPI001565AD2A|nr:metallophosphoesterase family protein [Neobacillus endophyticus]NRD79013.1 metallophosphoesterase family protein [Neobacillus endophyticus]